MKVPVMKIKQWLIVLFILVAMPGLTTASELAVDSSKPESRLQIGASLNNTTWTRNDKTSNLGELESSAAGLDLSVAYLRDKWSAGLSVQGGSFDAKDGELYPGYNVALPDDAEVEVNRVDIVFAYYFWPQVSVFTGIKSYTQEISKGDDFSLDYSGLGIGVSAFQPLGEKWNLFGSIANTPLTIKADDEKVGKATSFAMEIGGVYALKPMTSLSVGIKVNGFESDFDNGATIENNLGGLRVGVQHQFVI